MQRDYAQAMHYFKLAAEGNDMEAMAHLGHMYANGLGAAIAKVCLQGLYSRTSTLHKKSPLLACSRFRIFVHKLLHVMYQLAVHHKSQDDEEVGVQRKQDFETARKWFKIAAASGNPSSQFALGYMYLTAQGVNQDPEEAIKYFSQVPERCGDGGEGKFGAQNQGVTSGFKSWCQPGWEPACGSGCKGSRMLRKPSRSV